MLQLGPSAAVKMSGCLFLVVVVQYKDSGFTLGPHFF